MERPLPQDASFTDYEHELIRAVRAAGIWYDRAKAAGQISGNPTFITNTLVEMAVRFLRDRRVEKTR